MPERKPRSQAQRDAQLKAMEAARGAAARRSEEKARRAREQADRDRELAEHIAKGHPFGWKNWEYSDDYKTETRVCRICGATETREVRL